MTSTTNPNTSFSMRRFMTHRRTGSEDSDALSSDEYDGQFEKFSKKQQQQQRTPSWLPSPRRKEPPIPVMIRRNGSIHMISSPLPPVPADMPRSSTSSLGSLDKDELSRSESRNSCSQNKAAKTLGLSDVQTSRSPSTRPRRPTRPIHGLLSPEDEKDEIDFTQTPRQSVAPLGPAVNIPERRASKTIDKRQSIASRNSKAIRRKTLEWSEDVQQLIKETDQAFKGVGSDFRDSHLASLDFEMPEAVPAPIATKPVEEKQERRLSTGATKEKELPRPRPRSASMGAATKSKPPPKMKKRAATSKKAGKPAPRLAKSNGMVSRWNLSENVTDILTGQRFKKIEADEMLTSARIEELSRAREEALKQKALQSDPSRASGESESSESLQNSTADLEKPLPAEPSGTEKSSEESQRPLSLVAELPSDQDVIRSDFSLKKTSTNDSAKKSEQADTSEGDDEEEDTSDDSEDDEDEVPDFMIDEGGASLVPPPKNPARNIDSAEEAASTVAELSASRRASAATQSKKRRSASTGLTAEENDDFVFLKSTPYSLTKPLFRHGPITLSKADMGKAMITMDDTMDWTAFQMAILGGAGELFPEETTDEDGKLIEDLADWFDTFGFESLGGLVIAEAPSSRSSSRSTVSSSRTSDDDLPIPLHCEDPTGLWSAPTGTGYDKAKFFRRSGGPRRWKADGGDGFSPRKDGAGSPPQSPMLPIVAGSDDEHDGVPMGYNLNHDLGDFLAWEAAHMNGSGF